MIARCSARVLAGVALSVLAGCTVYVHENPPPRRVVVVEERPAPPPPPPPPPAEIVITESDEVHYVVYREYFGCSDVEVYAYPQYRRYYAVTDDDLYFITFVARRRGIAFDVCFRSYYYDCGRNYDRLVVTYNVPRSAFFCSAGVGVTAYPPVYHRTYAAYQQGNVSTITIQNNEYVALVHMKVAVEYQGHPPATYFAQVNAHGGNTGQVIVANRESCGKGGVTATGAKVTTAAPRPWTMPPQQKQAWHEEHKAQVVKHEDNFKEVHKEQVTRVQAQQKAPAQGNAPKAGPAAGGRPAPEQNPKAAPAQKPAHTPEGPAPGAAGAKHPEAEGDPRGQKPPAPAGAQGQGQGAKHPQGEGDPRGQKQPQGEQPHKEDPHRQAEGGKQPPPKEKGKSEEDEKKGGK